MSHSFSVSPATYKDRPAFRITSGVIDALFLPEDGGKVASVVNRRDGFAYLCENPAEKYGRLAYDGRYVDAECAGWDDMFPTIDPWTPAKGDFSGVEWPDHGEISRMPATVTQTDTALVLSFESRILPYRYVKTVTPLSEHAAGPSADGFCVTYAVTNTGKCPLPYIWAAHCMLAGSDGLRITDAYPPDAPRAYMFGGKNAPSLPTDRLTGFVPGNGDAYKYYYLTPTPRGYVRASWTDASHSLTFDWSGYESCLPYVGLWLNNGRFHNLYNIAVECCSSPYDSPGLAGEHGYARSLQPGETVSFSLNLIFE